MRRLILSAVAVLAIIFRQQGAYAFEDWRDGDLVFQKVDDAEGAAIRAATGSRYTHVGIVRITGGGPYVVEVHPQHGVGEVPLDEFLARGVGQAFAAYRFQGLSARQANVVAAAPYGSPYQKPHDPFLRFDSEAYYGGELVHHAFRAIGIDIGRAQRLGELDVGHAAVEEFLLRRWRDHPDCRARGLARDGCRDLMLDQTVKTPAAIAADARLMLMADTFGSL